ADVQLDGQRLFTAISLYAQWEMMPGSKTKYGGPRLHRMLSDLTGVLTRSRRGSVLLAGDFNVTSQGFRSRDNEAAAAVARLRGWGLQDSLASKATSPLKGCRCPDGDACRHIKTYRTGAQLDYAFASPSLSEAVACHAEDTAKAWTLSDHCPPV